MRTKHANCVPPPRHRIHAATPDAVALVVDGLASVEGPAHFPIHAAYLADRLNYAAAVSEIGRRLRPRHEHRLCETILESFSLQLKAYRCAVDLDFIPVGKTGRVWDVRLETLIAAPGRRGMIGWTIAHLLGFLKSPQGLMLADETSPAAPGFWPGEESCRLALALNWIARTRHGERLHWHFAVKP